MDIHETCWYKSIFSGKFKLHFDARRFYNVKYTRIISSSGLVIAMLPSKGFAHALKLRGEINIKPDGFHKMLNFHCTSKMKVQMESLFTTAPIMISVVP